MLFRSHKGQFLSYRGNPAISEGALDGVLSKIDHAFNGLNALPGKAGHSLASNEFLMAVRSRISIPGGTCEFDLPAYYAWQQREPAKRRTDLLAWLATLAPLAEALQTLLQLVREGGVPHKVACQAGQFQQSLPPGKSYQLLRLRLDPGDHLVPEITGHRLLVSVRLMQADADGRLRPAPLDMPMELTLCA